MKDKNDIVCPVCESGSLEEKLGTNINYIGVGPMDDEIIDLAKKEVIKNVQYI